MTWNEFILTESEKPYFRKLMDFATEERKNFTVYPEPDNVFKAFQVTPFDKVKVVIVSQDPYHGPNQAMGLAFSVPKEAKIPPSLRNIYKEIQDDIGIDMSQRDGDLTHWAEQGVFLLNTVLTVRAGQADSHRGKGWAKFTDAAIEALDKDSRSKTFLLWGNHARQLRAGIKNSNHLILEAAHPSPLSASRGFFGCGHFSQVNWFLQDKGRAPIIW